MLFHTETQRQLGSYFLLHLTPSSLLLLVFDLQCFMTRYTAWQTCPSSKNDEKVAFSDQDGIEETDAMRIPLAVWKKSWTRSSWSAAKLVR